ncbi:MAG: UDP-N-acetylmuramoyl-L-alanine--D-glutamate ligase [Rickettsiales bacterium]|jgi:UDP-N-acetylmuramoylalanine--D-glutamate ligase|nr:UDP-N-acetylmuramoyl-L-alanine--D-glutamate ligase [Rickettsiales bacterium]
MNITDYKNLITLKYLEDKNIGIWGSGVEGKAVLEKLKSLYPYKNIDILNDENAKDFIDKLDIIIKSPGVSIYKPEIQNAKKTIFITEKTIFYSELALEKVVTIGITGTKGKTTSSTFCDHILKKIGYKTLLTGNIGVPTIGLIDEAKKSDFVITELSSYQCSDLISFPKVGILLNLYHEHVDWHRTRKNYYGDKLHLLSGVNIVISKYKTKINPLTVTYRNGFWRLDNKKLWNTKNMKLLGEHNYRNFSFIFSALHKIGVDLSKIKQEHIDEFMPIEHRLEIVKKDNITFVNDSISTIPQATIACYKTFKNYNIYGILGGFDRKQSYNSIISYLKKNKNIRYFALIGQTAQRIAKSLDDNGIQNYKVCDNLTECVNLLKQQSVNTENPAIILSPASPSYDMFKDFKERGMEFKKLI